MWHPVQFAFHWCNSHVVLGVSGNQPVLSVRHEDVLFLWLASRLQTTLDYMSNNNHHHQGTVERSQGCRSCWSLASSALRKILKKSFHHCYVNSETLESNRTIRAQADPCVSSSLWIWKPHITVHCMEFVTAHNRRRAKRLSFTTGPPVQTKLKLPHNGRCSDERSAHGEVAFNMFFHLQRGQRGNKHMQTKWRWIWETLKLQGVSFADGNYAKEPQLIMYWFVENASQSIFQYFLPLCLTDHIPKERQVLRCSLKRALNVHQAHTAPVLSMNSIRCREEEDTVVTSEAAPRTFRPVKLPFFGGVWWIIASDNVGT